MRSVVIGVRAPLVRAGPGLAVAIAAPAGAWAGIHAAQPGATRVVVPPAVAMAIAEGCPGAEITVAEKEAQAGITFYGLELEAGRGEIEVAAVAEHQPTSRRAARLRGSTAGMPCGSRVSCK